MTFPHWPRILCLESSQSRARRTKSRGTSRPPWRRSPRTAESTCSSSLVTRPCSCDIYIWRYTRLCIVINYIATLLLSIIIHKSSLISVEIAKWMFQSYLPVPTPTLTLSSIEYFDMNNSHFYLLSILLQWYLIFTTQSDLVQTVSSTENAENYLKRVPLTLKINPYFLDFQSLRF